MAKLRYKLIRSSRKTLGMQVKDGELIVRAPRLTPRFVIDRFVEENRAWAEKTLQKAAAADAAPKLTDKEIEALRQKAKAYLPGRVAYYAARVGVTVGTITVRCQKTKWGSCSGKGNLNFNCLLMLLPPEVIDSVVVHEVCHRRHMDHSAAFYAEIDRVFPDYKKYHAYLKQHGAEIMARAAR